MKTVDVKDKENKELLQEVSELKIKLSEDKFARFGSDKKDTSKYKVARKEIARLLTKLNDPRSVK